MHWRLGKFNRSDELARQIVMHEVHNGSIRGADKLGLPLCCDGIVTGCVVERRRYGSSSISRTPSSAYIDQLDAAAQQWHWPFPDQQFVGSPVRRILPPLTRWPTRAPAVGNKRPADENGRNKKRKTTERNFVLFLLHRSVRMLIACRFRDIFCARPSEKQMKNEKRKKVKSFHARSTENFPLFLVRKKGRKITNQ